jgi:hypothetical protein
LLNFTLKHYKIAVYLLLILFAISTWLSPAMTVNARVQDVLEWVEVDKPKDTGNIVVPGSDISKIAASTNSVVYAIDSIDNSFYRSTNSGSTWTDITTIVRNYVPAGESFADIAVAADKPQVVTLVTDTGVTNKVYVSIDGGDYWYSTSLPAIAGTIQSINISRGYYKTGTTINWDVAIGTAIWGGGATTDGEVWVLTVGDAISSWKNQNVFVDASVIHADISAVYFSSNYGEDQTMMVVASTGGDVGAYSNKTYFCLGKRDVVAQSTTWNTVINPILITNEGDDAGVRTIISNIALPSDYNATNLSNRIVFISYNRKNLVIPYDSAFNDVYRINDSLDPANAVRLYAGNATGDAEANISSLTMNGSISTGSAGVSSGILVAGDYYVSTWPYVQVRRSLNPFDTTVSWQRASKPPTGPGSAQVVWNSSGTELYCGTGRILEFVPPDPDESGFSISADNGDTWEQVSLIDTVVRICDIMPAPDSKSLFISAYNDFTLESVWRTAGTPLGKYWGRILSTDTTSNRLILRLSPDYRDDYTIYAAEEAGSYIAVSHDRGNYWYEYTMPSEMIDMAIADKKTVYIALPDGMIRKSENQGQVWGYPYLTGLENINMIHLTDNGHMLVGSRDGQVAYSTDNCESFTIISVPVGNYSDVCDVQVVPDNNYAENNIIYAATNIAEKGIWRWTIGESSEWEWIDKAIADLNTGETFCGLAMGEEGTLYALRMEPADGNGSGGMNRSLNSDYRYALEIEWDVLNRTLPVGIEFNPNILFSHTLPFLKISGDDTENVLWSVSTDNITDQHIYAFVDNLCKTGAVVEDVGEIGCDPASGRSQGISFVWEQLSLSDEYEVNIAKDTGFTMRLDEVEPPDNPYFAPYSITKPAYVVEAGQVFECGHSFYWRMRTRHAVTGEYIRSPWSEVDPFLVKAGYKVTTPYYGPQLLAPDNQCGCQCSAPVCFSWSPYKETEAYWFELSENYDMSNPLVSTEVGESTAYEYTGKLKCGTNYFWRVMAISPVSDWSAVFSFITADDVSSASVDTDIQVFKATPLWVWMIIGTISILIVSLLVLIVRRHNS